MKMDIYTKTRVFNTKIEKKLIKARNPVNLFKEVCRMANWRCLKYTIDRFNILIRKIEAICGKKERISDFFFRITETIRIINKTRSAKESSLAPNSLSVFVFLAIYPSRISDNPHQKLINKNATLLFK